MNQYSEDGLKNHLAVMNDEPPPSAGPSIAAMGVEVPAEGSSGLLGGI